MELRLSCTEPSKWCLLCQKQVSTSDNMWDAIICPSPSLKQILYTLHWRHNDPDSVSNHQPHDCLLNCLFRRRSKKTSKLRVTGLCVGNSPGTGEFPAQMASNAENVSIWWRHHDISQLENSRNTISTHLLLNSSPLTAAYMRQWTRSALVQVMACRLFGAKTLPEQVMA